MKNLFNKFNKENVKASLINGVSKTLGTVHFVLQSSADLITEVEVKIVTSTKEYDADLVRRSRAYKTAKQQQSIINRYDKASKRIAEAKQRAKEDIIHNLKRTSNSVKTA